MRTSRSSASQRGAGGRRDSKHGRGPFLASVADPRAWLHLVRLVHYYNYTHVAERRRVTLGREVKLAPNVSFANGDRIKIGDYAHVGARCSLWAGDTTGRITLGEHALLGPEVFITASNYQTTPGIPIMHQPRDEQDVIIGDDVWLGARAIVVAGVHIGDGCVVGAGAVVTRSLPPHSIAAGNPARVIGMRVEGQSPDPGALVQESPSD
jgi:acetyltransferase-like isoleucine patch superfamily enzyme